MAIDEQFHRPAEDIFAQNPLRSGHNSLVVDYEPLDVEQLQHHIAPKQVEVGFAAKRLLAIDEFQVQSVITAVNFLSHFCCDTENKFEFNFSITPRPLVMVTLVLSAYG